MLHSNNPQEGAKIRSPNSSLCTKQSHLTTEDICLQNWINVLQDEASAKRELITK